MARIAYHDIADCQIESFDCIVLSPGPSRPENYPETMSLIHHFWRKKPFLGICLGHQMLGVYQGFGIERCKDPHHGSLRTLSWLPELDPTLTQIREVGVYNSLSLKETGQEKGHVIARCEKGEIQSVLYCEGSLNGLGLQFHPESFLSIAENGLLLDQFFNWITEPLPMPS